MFSHGPEEGWSHRNQEGCGQEAAGTARAPLSPREPCEELRRERSSPYFGKLRPGERAASCCAAPSARLTSAERNHVRGSHRHKKRRRTPRPDAPLGHRAAPAAPPLLRAPPPLPAPLRLRQYSTPAMPRTWLSTKAAGGR